MDRPARNLARAKARARAILLACALAMLALLGWPLATLLMPEPPPSGDTPQPEPR